MGETQPNAQCYKKMLKVIWKKKRKKSRCVESYAPKFEIAYDFK